MRKLRFLAVTLLAAVGLLAVFATSASAYEGGYGQRCDTLNCHGGGGVAPIVTLVSNSGTTATYSLSQGGIEWAVFDGPARIAGIGGATSTGEFTVAVGSTYTVFAVYAQPGSGTSGQTAVSPSGSATTTFTITPTAGGNGSISPSTVQSVASGASSTFAITADSGYHIADVLVDGLSIGAVTTRTFTNVTANHTIAASFAVDGTGTFTITPTAGANGSISPSAVQSVASGASSTFTISAASGYHVADVLVDGLSVGAVTTRTFTNVTANHTIAASFAVDATGTFTITPSAGKGGLISPSMSWTVASGGSLTVAIFADSGYHIDTVLVDGAPVSIMGGDFYTFSNVTANHTIAAAFAKNTVTEPVTTSLVLKASAKSVRDRAYVTFSSVLSGGVPAGTHVRYQVRLPGKHTYVTISSTRSVSASGFSSIRYRLTKKGTYYVRSRFMGIEGFGGSISNVVKVVVR